MISNDFLYVSLIKYTRKICMLPLTMCMYDLYNSRCSESKRIKKTTAPLSFVLFYYEMIIILEIATHNEANLINPIKLYWFNTDNKILGPR